MFSCDYNGWADVPEDEREAVEAFECATERSAAAPPRVLIRMALPSPEVLPQHKAA